MQTGTVVPSLTVPRELSAIERVIWYGWDETDQDCFETRMFRDKDGYGCFTVNGIPEKAHRVAYESWVGPIPSGKLVRHICDNPPCVNPGHLEPGTQGDNTKDRDTRGRTARGERSGNSKLTSQQVEEIRRRRAKEGTRYKELAKEFNVTEGLIGHIINNRIWKTTYGELRLGV